MNGYIFIMVSSMTSSISEKSMVLLPDGEHSQPAGTLPSSIQIEHNAEEDEATLVISPTVSLANAHREPTSQEKNQAHHPTASLPNLKHSYPKELIQLNESNPLGQRIFATILMEANVKEYDSSFKHSQKLQFLTNIHLTSFVNEGCLN